MKLADIPLNKFSAPFADAAGAGFVQLPIPSAPQTGGRASINQGFPPENFQPVGAGGIPPWGADMNGILKQITLWSRWGNAGGLIPYDSAFATSIGGYPKSAMLAGTTAGVVWLSTLDDNTSDPNAGGNGWAQVATAPDVQSGKWTYAVAGGSANGWTLSTNPATAAYGAGRVLWIICPATNTSTTVTATIGALAARRIKKANGADPDAGDLIGGVVYPTIDDGTNIRVVSPLPSDISAVPNLTYIGVWSQSLTDGTQTTITGYTPTTVNLLDATFSSGNLTVGPKSAGLWMAIFNAVSPNANMELVATVTTAAGAIGYGTSRTTVGAPGVAAIALVKLAAGDQLWCTCRQISGGTLTITGRINLVRMGG